MKVEFKSTHVGLYDYVIQFILIYNFKLIYVRQGTNVRDSYRYTRQHADSTTTGILIYQSTSPASTLLFPQQTVGIAFNGTSGKYNAAFVKRERKTGDDNCVALCDG